MLLKIESTITVSIKPIKPPRKVRITFSMMNWLIRVMMEAPNDFRMPISEYLSKVKTGSLHKLRNIAIPLKRLDCCVQVSICCLVAGEEAANEGDNVSQVEEICGSEDEVGWQGEFKY